MLLYSTAIARVRFFLFNVVLPKCSGGLVVGAHVLHLSTYSVCGRRSDKPCVLTAVSGFPRVAWPC